MPSTVYTLTETNGRTGYVLGVFAERATALEAARSWAQRRIVHCLAQDEKTFGRPFPADTYAMALSEPDEHASVSIVHALSGETDGMAWQIWPFDVVEKACAEHADNVGHLADAA